MNLIIESSELWVPSYEKLNDPKIKGQSLSLNYFYKSWSNFIPSWIEAMHIYPHSILLNAKLNDVNDSNDTIPT